MRGRVRDLLIGDCGRRVDNLVSKNIEETLPNFYWLYRRKKNSLISIELLCPCSFVLNTNVGVVTVIL